MKQQYHKRQKAVHPTHPSPSRGEGKGEGEKGFTLVELMIAIVIGVIVIGATYATYISQQRSFTAQDQVAEMNSTSKIALDMIANDIRETGFGVPDDLATFQRVAGCSGINGFTQKINFIPGTDDLTSAPDRITLLGGFRRAGELQNSVLLGSNTITLKNVDILPNTTDRAYISIGGISFAIVTGIAGDTLTITPTLNRSYPAGVPVYLVENITYQVSNNRLERVRRSVGPGCNTTPDTDVIAENIEDLQFVLLDVPADGITDRIRVNILATTARDDPNFRGQGSRPAQIENRNLPAITDSLRRRWWQMEVDLRNQI